MVAKMGLDGRRVELGYHKVKMDDRKVKSKDHGVGGAAPEGVAD